MKVLVLGGSGTLGRDLLHELGQAGHDVLAPSHEHVDLGAPDTLAEYLDENEGIEALINAAAYADVDGCERDPRRATTVNARGPQRAAVLCAHRGIHFLHVSTDYVFDGEKGAPYDEDDEPNPVQEYGRSKLEGEHGALDAGGRVAVARTSMLMGAAGNNFANKVLAKAALGEEIRAVTDWVGSPTGTPDLARGLLRLMDGGATGVFHVANSGSCSRYEQAEMILKAAGMADAKLTAIDSSSLKLEAQRPKATALVSKKLEWKLPPIADAVKEFVQRSSST